MKGRKLIIIIGSVTLIAIIVAIFTIIYFPRSIVFSTSDGIIITEKEVKLGTTIKELEIPKKQGYAFQYWTINGKKCKDTDKIKNGDMLEAVYKDIYVIVFDTDGGSVIESIEVLDGAILKKPVSPTKEDYIFKYWSNNEIEYDFSQPINKNITLKAIWETKYYCEEGYTLKDKKCTKEITINATVNKSCSKYEDIHYGELYDGKCIDTFSGSGALGKCDIGVYSVVLDSCYEDNGFDKYIGEPTGITCDEREGDYVLKDGMCYPYEEAEVSYSCPTGYEKNNTECRKTETIDAKIKEN